MIRVRLQTIEQLEVESKRPKGYTAHCKSLAEKEADGWLEFTKENYQKLVETYKGKNQKSSIVNRFVNAVFNGTKAATSVAKTSVGIDVTTEEEYEARLEVCRNCPGNHAIWTHKRQRYSEPNEETLAWLRSDPDAEIYTCGQMLKSLTASGKGTCGCVLSKKAKDRKQDCPFEYWPKLTKEETKQF